MSFGCLRKILGRYKNGNTSCLVGYVCRHLLYYAALYLGCLIKPIKARLPSPLPKAPPSTVEHFLWFGVGVVFGVSFIEFYLEMYTPRDSGRIIACV